MLKNCQQGTFIYSIHRTDNGEFPIKINYNKKSLGSVSLWGCCGSLSRAIPISRCGRLSVESFFLPQSCPTVQVHLGGESRFAPSSCMDHIPPPLSHRLRYTYIFRTCVWLASFRRCLSFALSGAALMRSLALWGKTVVDRLYYLSPGLPGPLCRDRFATVYC